MKLTSFALILILISHSAFACQELIWTPEQYTTNSKSVYIGLVQSISLPESNEIIKIEKYINLTRVSGHVNVTLKVLESLKGADQDTLNVSLNWCGGGQYELGDLVVAYNLGEHWHVKNSKPAIMTSIKALTSR